MRVVVGRHSRRLFACALTFTLLLGVTAVSAEPDSPPKRLGRTLRLLDPSIEVPTHAFAEWSATGQREARAISDYRGKVVVLNFWATWCGVCKREMPRLDALIERLDPTRVEVIAISIDEDPRVLRDAFDARGYSSLRIYHDEQSALYPLMGTRGVPTTFVVDPTGRAVAKSQGPTDWDSAEAAAWLDSLVPAKPDPIAPSGSATASDQSSSPAT